MKAVVLAGGFARRLWPLTKEIPKPLLRVGGKPIIEYILEKLAAVDEIDRIYISINQKFEPCFREWAGRVNTGKEIEIVVEPARSEEEKLGAIGALAFLMDNKGVNDDMIVVAGDNLFNFDLKKFLGLRQDGMPVVALYDMKDRERISGKYGVAVLGENNAIKELHEKPEEPATTIISTGCYFFPKETVKLVSEYLRQGNCPDAPGFFISWLSGRMKVQGYVFDGECSWFDIGSKESYQEADKAFSEIPAGK